ncbi:MAG: hypothetical protein QOE86_3840 [Solirubrobacteraceae bacterium]|nr:hypothetical protein [Solirubrobacteraceae bacterium]
MQQRRPLWAWPALAVLLLLGGAFVVYLTRGTTLWVDEWSWYLGRRHGSLLEPHNGHLSAVPLLVYRLLFSAFGADRSLPFRVVLVAAHLGVVTLLFVYARRRVGDWPALGAALLLLTFGPAWQDILWPFQIGWLISLACGVGALLALDRRDRLGDVAAAVLLGIALASSGLGVPLAIGLGLDIALGRRSWRAAPIVLVPLALYALWWLVYQDEHTIRSFSGALQFAVDSAASTLSSLAGLTGLTGPGLAGDRPAIGWGRPLMLLVIALLIWRRPLSPRTIVLLAIPVAFWFATGIERSLISVPETSRYLYVGGLFVLLAASEVARGRTVPRHLAPLLVLAVAVVVFSNTGVLRRAAADLRRDGTDTRALLAVVDLQPQAFPDRAELKQMPGYPFTLVEAGRYRAAARAVGTPADSPAELAAATPPARLVADKQLISAVIGGLHTVDRPPPPGPSPTLDRASGVFAGPARGCIEVAAPLAGPPAPAAAELTVPPGGFRVTATRGDVALTLRRFGDSYAKAPQGRVRAGATAVLRLATDAAPAPWHLRIAPAQRATVCGLAAL